MRRYLRVLCYHRIGEPGSVGELGWRPVISATPEDFAAHMSQVAEFGHPVSLTDVIRHVEGTGSLPARPILVTFDDGYKDNLEIASDVLAAKGIPAVLFVATDWVDRGEPFFWDVAGEAFRRTSRSSFDLPLLGPVAWRDDRERFDVANQWIERAKRLAPDPRARATRSLLDRLDVDDPASDLQTLRLDWDDVRRMAEDGWEIGAHTAGHTILSTVDRSTAEREIVSSRDRIKSELGKEVTAFAYPNGGAADYQPTHVDVLGAAGFSLAFTLRPGPMRLDRVVDTPLEIRRIFVGNGDSSDRFRVKLRATPWVRMSLRTLASLRRRVFATRSR